MDNIGDDWHNPLLQMPSLGLPAPNVGDLTYSAVTQGQYLAGARSPRVWSRPPPLLAPIPPEVGAAQFLLDAGAGREIS